MGISAGMEASAETPAEAGRLRGYCALVNDVIHRRATWALVDQAVVSGGSFLTVVAVARGGGDAGEVGLYGLGFSIIATLYAVQTALITTPFSLRRRRRPSMAARAAGGAAVLQLILTVLATGGLLVASVALAAYSALYMTEMTAYRLGGVLLATGLACPALLLREFMRRVAYAHLRVGWALTIDIPSTLLQLGMLGALIWAGRMTAGAAMMAMGVSAAIGVAVGMVILRGCFARPGWRWPAYARASWRSGKWIGAAQALGAANAHGVLWLVAICINEEAVGIFAACLWVVMLTNPFVYGLGNLLTPRSAEVLAVEGARGLNRLIVRAVAVLGGVTGLFAIMMALMGGVVLRLIYGEDYGGYAHVAWVLAAAYAISAAGMAVNDGLRALGRADIELIATAIDTLLTFVIGIVAMLQWGLVGLAYATLAGSAVATVLQSAWYWRLIKRRERC